MTDDELCRIVEESARLDPRSTEGVDAIFALASKLGAEPELAEQPLRTVAAGWHSHSVNAEFVAKRMLHITRESGGASAVAWLRKIPHVTRGEGGAVKVLYGVECKERIALSDDVVLLPYKDLPPSGTRDWIMDEHARAASEQRLLLGFTVPPAAGLYRPAAIEPFFVPPGAQLDEHPSRKWFDDLDSAALLLALTPTVVPSEVARWMHFDDPDIALLGQFGITRSQTELPSSLRMRVPTEVTAESAGGLLSLWRALGGTDSRRLKLALERLIRSRAQQFPGDRAIDIAIALEVLFMNERGEHSYKISLRAARLLRASQPARRKVFLEVKQLYEIRSKMVHTGEARGPWTVDGEQRSAADLVEAVDRLCTEAIRIFLTNGGITKDWKALDLA